MADLQLTPEEEQQMRAVLQSMQEVEQWVTRFKRAGFDAGALEQNIKAVKAGASGLLREFSAAGAKASR